MTDQEKIKLLRDALQRLVDRRVMANGSLKSTDGRYVQAQTVLDLTSR